MKLVFLGSGAFGLPSFERLAAEHDVVLVVTQPDRPAGRNRRLTETPIALAAGALGIPVLKPESVNDPDVVAAIHGVGADAFVIIAYGQKLGVPLLAGTFAINLHGSLLPKYRGAAPISRAMMDGVTTTGVSVIGIAQRMDAGAVYARASVAIDPGETAGELHDRLALLGPEVMLRTLDDFARGAVAPEEQDELLACPAPKLSRAEATVSFDQPADRVRARVHGLTPWPGCTVAIGERRLKLLRMKAIDDGDPGAPGTIRDDGAVRCASGAVALLEVQPAGKKPMTFEAYRRGHPLPPDARLEALPT